MKKKILGILDVDEEYAMNLVAFMNKRNYRECEIAGFTSVENVAQYLKHKSIELLLVSDKIDAQKVRELNIDKIIVLSEEDKVNTEQPTVYKYQSAQLLVREVMTYYAQMETAQITASGRMDLVKKIGVFSLSQPCQRMMAAMSIAQEKGEQEPVLYLNFEEYTGIRSLLNLEGLGNLSDFIYYYENQKEHLEEKLACLVQRRGNMDMLAPFTVGQDLHSLHMQEWRSILHEITLISHYHTIILDIGVSFELLDWLELCDEIYLVYEDCGEDRVRTEEFKEYVAKVGEIDILDKLHYIQVSEKNSWREENFLEQLCESNFYQEVISQMAQ